MFPKLTRFATVFCATFSEIMEQEAVALDLVDRVPGTGLGTPRGLFGPAVMALCKAVKISMQDSSRSDADAVQVIYRDWPRREISAAAPADSNTVTALDRAA
jgi:hypothetical protein